MKVVPVKQPVLVADGFLQPQSGFAVGTGDVLVAVIFHVFLAWTLVPSRIQLTAAS
jgi:hypothetical protein